MRQTILLNQKQLGYDIVIQTVISDEVLHQLQALLGILEYLGQLLHILEYRKVVIQFRVDKVGRSL